MLDARCRAPRAVCISRARMRSTAWDCSSRARCRRKRWPISFTPNWPQLQLRPRQNRVSKALGHRIMRQCRQSPQEGLPQSGARNPSLAHRARRARPPNEKSLRILFLNGVFSLHAAPYSHFTEQGNNTQIALDDSNFTVKTCGFMYCIYACCTLSNREGEVFRGREIYTGWWAARRGHEPHSTTVPHRVPRLGATPLNVRVGVVAADVANQSPQRLGVVLLHLPSAEATTRKQKNHSRAQKRKRRI